MTYLNVFNCKANFIINNKMLDEERLTEKQKEALNKLKDYVIYTENQGAINWSGIYLMSNFSIELLKEILKGNTEVIEEIAQLDETDFEKKAIELVENLKDFELILVYDSGLLCSDLCSGYHTRNYVAKINNKFYIVNNGYGHHHGFLVNGENVASLGVSLKEITKEEAIEKVRNFLKIIADKYDYTIVELENYEKEEEKLYYCEKCKKYEIVFYDDEHICDDEDEEY